MEMFDDMDVEMFVISSDLPVEQVQLFNDLKAYYGYSVSFISDPDLQLIDLMNMKNGNMAYRGYALMDAEGNVVFHKINDQWGEEIEKTVEEIKEQYDRIN